MSIRSGLATAVRLLVTAPLFAAGLGAMLLAITAWTVFATALLTGLGLAVLSAGVDYLPLDPWPWGFLAVGVLAVVFGLWFWVHEAWRLVRDGLRLEPAAMVARTRRPGDAAAERTAAETLSRLCQHVALQTHALRVRDAEEPLCYTVRYPVETPPRELLKGDVDRFRDWNVESRERELDVDDDEPIPEDHVVVVSTGLLAALPDRELQAVLAHEVAHLRNGDLRLLNAFLLPVFWAEGVVARTEIGSVWDPIEEVVLPLLVMGVASLTSLVTDLGVATFARGREFAADRAAAEVSGDPAALASALERLDDSAPDRPETDMRTVAVANVLPTTDEDRSGLLASHPPTEARIRRLRAMVTDRDG